ncbi:helix-turn-helix domain-containing protein [Streptomyces thinghirensis]|nr:helix-turn-helix domain-containing protein [Streptomyces thinghirensis]
MQHGPVVRRRKLGAELRALRTSAGITSGEAARLVGWHQSKVSRIETGTSGAKPADVRLLLDAYGVDDDQLRELLVMLAGSDDAGGRNHWWHAYRGVLPRPTATSSAWSPRPARCARWRPRWSPGCCRHRSTPAR